ncbi:RNA-directed DNA polymerase [Flavobacterium psychrophilum]|nr:RNA-directed DNA polymerase [Flavobacterium psychrophilum]
MFDQSFSSKTFQEIFDKENRKGKNIEKRFKNDFVESLETLKKIKNLSLDIRAETNSNTKKALYKERKDLKKMRDKQISSILEKTAEKLSSRKTVVEITEGENFGGQSYQFEENIENYFLSKKIQNNISEFYKVKQSNRHSILSELINQLEDKFPKYVVRTDIKSFYESIPQKKLLDKMDDDYLLSILTKKYITETFASYRELTLQTDIETAKGIPRGIGFSAYLSELFMRKIDNQIKALDDLVYYARYVDDIIAIFIPVSTSIDKNYLKQYKIQIEEIIVNQGLSLNTEKTNEFNLLNGIGVLEYERQIFLNGKFKKIQENEGVEKINFLGYRIGTVLEINKIKNKNSVKESKQQNLIIELSENKINKYKDKIKLAFKEFSIKSLHNKKLAFKLLNSRVQYLTSNTKLRNNKDKVFVGIYYSNLFLNGKKSLETIQRNLNWHIVRANINNDEKEILKKHNFLDGFEHRKFNILPLVNRKYKNHNCKMTDVRNRRNNGIIQFGLTEINSIWRK